jgi:5-hydroxyisourate hydrolase
VGRLTTHVLDTAHGCPGADIAIRLSGQGQTVEARTNADGRWEAPATGALTPGRYVLSFAVGDYFRARGVKLPDPPFLDVVDIAFGIADAGAHYHVPLLVSPFSYSTYRGS